MHTEMTLHHFDNSTTQLDCLFWRFRQDVCGKFHTHDLPHELAARARRQRVSTVNRKGKQRADLPSSDGSSTKQRSFNMLTYKMHSLGDYVKSIWLYGTTDNYSTQIVCFLPVLLVRYYLLHWPYFRVSSSIDEWSGFTLGQTRLNSPVGLPCNSVVNGSFIGCRT